jgi:peptide/nickel transport system permease protein
MSMILVTHDLGVIADICDDVAVMYAGQVVESGAMVGVLENPQHPYTMALLAADPHNGDAAREGRLASIPGQVPAPQDWPTGCRFAQRCVFAQPRCTDPVALTPRTGDAGEVRCVRGAELHASGLRWTSAPPATTRPAATKRKVRA